MEGLLLETVASVDESNPVENKVSFRGGGFGADSTGLLGFEHVGEDERTIECFVLREVINLYLAHQFLPHVGDLLQHLAHLVEIEEVGG